MPRSLFLVLLATVAVPVLAADPPAAQEKLPVAVVNLQKVMFQSVPGKAVVEEFNAYATKMQEAMNAKQDEAAKARAELQEKDKTLKEDEKERLKKKAADLEAAAKQIESEAQTHLQKLETNAIPQLQQEIDRLIKEYAKERGIQLVIDQSPQPQQRGAPPRPLNVLVINPACDISDEIIKRLATFKIKPPAEEKAEAKPQVLIQTSLGDIVVELDPAKAPITVANFLKYVDDKHYDGTVFHRVVKDYVVQGGGHTATLAEKPTRPPIKNEASMGPSNVRGTIAMARDTPPDTATSQFYINMVDNSKKLDYRGPDYPGYCVFGKVVNGMDVVDKIHAGKTRTVGQMENVPVELVTVKSARRLTGPEK
jgi:cyclophilin family peptidyl-prolyl cis-trans isomerase/Skp family chaperone for outer membrane proteins